MDVTPAIDALSSCVTCQVHIVYDELFGWMHTSIRTGAGSHLPQPDDGSRDGVTVTGRETSLVAGPISTTVASSAYDIQSGIRFIPGISVGITGLL